MGAIFSAEEVLKIAVEIEKNGHGFYRDMLPIVTNSRIAGIFRALANQEKQHIQVFTEMLKEVGSEEAGNDNEEYQAYLKALSQEHVFIKDQQFRERVKMINTDDDALAFAAGFEQESIRFYEKIKTVVPVAGQTALEKVIAQEKLHLQKLTELK
jgi:rubrerythrin